MSNEKFAEKLGISVRTVASWRQKPDFRQQSDMQQILDTALEQATDAERARCRSPYGPADELPHVFERPVDETPIGTALREIGSPT